MNKKTINDKPVTYAVFNQSMRNIDEKFDRMAIELVNVKQEVQEMKIELKTEIATKTDRIMTQVDNLANMWKEQNQKGYFNQNRLNNLDDQVADHEKRLVALEGGQRGPA